MNAWRWVLMLVIVLVIAGVSKAWLTAWLFYGFGAILLLALAVAWRPAKLQTARRRMNATHAEIGQEVIVDVALAWERPIGGAWVLAQDTVSPGLKVVTSSGRLMVGGAGTQTSYAYRVVGVARGYYALGPLRLSCGDLFGIARKDSAEDSLGFLTVYPRVLPVPPIRLPSNRPLGDVRTRRRLQDDPTRMEGVREYRPGDPLSKIHWKATARSGTLASKIFEASSDIEVTLVLNLAREDYPDGGAEVELACTTAASLAAALLLERDAVSLQSNGLDAAAQYARRPGTAEPVSVRQSRDTAQLPSLLAGIARLTPSPSHDLANYLTEIHSRLPWTSTLLLITHRLSDYAAQALESLSRSGFALALIIVGEGTEAKAALNRAAALNLLTARVPSEAHLATLEFWRPGRS